MKGLYLNENNIGDEGAIALSKSIHLIDMVDIRYCGVTKVGVKSLADALVTSNYHVSFQMEFTENKVGRILYCNLLLTNKSSEPLRLPYFAVRKTVATTVKQSKEKSWEKFGQKLDTDCTSANRVFRQVIP